MQIIREKTHISVPMNFITDYMGKLSLSETNAYLLFIALNQAGVEAELSEIATKLGLTDKGLYDVIYSLERKGLIRSVSSEPLSIYIEDFPVSLQERSTSRSLFETIEGIKGSPLSSNEVAAFDFISYTLSFSDDLAIYLARLCAEKGSFTPNYLKSVAIKWHDAGIDSVEKAKSSSSGRFDKIVYQALGRLGRTGLPTAAEADVILKWTTELNMPDDVILYACDKTSVLTGRNRLLYCDAILCDYAKNNIRTLKEAENYKSAPVKEPSKGASGSFMQKSYDFEELERQLVENQGNF